MSSRGRIRARVDRRVRTEAAHRCGYCHCPQWLLPFRLEIEHIYPISLGGSDDESNLWLACRTCNSHKSNKVNGVDPETGEEVPLFNPRMEVWAQHFMWSEDGRQLIGLTPVGRATVVALHLNDDPDVMQARELWIAVGWHPPKE